MKTVIDGFEEAGLGHIKMAVGGAPISQMFADEIGADGYGADASAAVDLFLRAGGQVEGRRAGLIAGPPCPSTLTINGRTRRRPRPARVAVRLRRARRRARAHVLRASRASAGSAWSRSTAGAELLSAADATRSSTSTARFRLSCRADAVAGDAGDVRCHTMRRGQLRIERRATGLPRRARRRSTRRSRATGDRVLIDGVDVGPLAGAIHGLAIDLGTTTVVLRLLRPRDGRARRRRVVREPAAVRRLRRDGAHPLRHRRTAAGC